MPKTNPDLDNERQHATIDLAQMKDFLGRILYGSSEKHRQMTQFRDELVTRVKPLFEENFYNLTREEKYAMLYDKSLQIDEFVREKHVAAEDTRHVMKLNVIGGVLGAEKILFTLHYAAFAVSLDLWGTEEQRAHWSVLMRDQPGLFGTYIQTELGHGTYVRGLETTATYDRRTREFDLHSPTLTSVKFWPGTGGITANYGIVMAKLVVEGRDCGVHAFVVQLRCLETHRNVAGVETGDIGPKNGFESHDNGYIRFTHVRVPLFNMLMRNAVVSAEGEFRRVGSELVMYACMLLLRASLCLYGGLLLSLSTTIAIRYSAVRRQTAAVDGIEPQILDYQTQQYRLFPALAATYAHFFAANHLTAILVDFRTKTNNFANINTTDLAKLHAVSAGLKALTFNNCLKFAQTNRLCCGGHGYSASSGLIPIIQEADGGCTYEGDNVILLLQTARYLLKCAQKGQSPHLEVIEDFGQSPTLAHFRNYYQMFFTLFDELIGEVASRMFQLVKEEGKSEMEAWNECSVQLVNAAKFFISLFIMTCNLNFIVQNKCEPNRQALSELFELHVLYDIVDTYSGSFLKFQVVSSTEMKELTDKLFSLLPKVRVNAVALVDSFDYLDSNLCSSLGSYDGNVYERLFEFAKMSHFNKKDVHDVFEKYLKPYTRRQKLISSKL